VGTGVSKNAGTVTDLGWTSGSETGCHRPCCSLRPACRSWGARAQQARLAGEPAYADLCRPLGVRKRD
jgi:hypothetical protein